MNGILAALDVMATLLVAFVGLAIVAIAVVFVLDVTQRKHAIRRNFPVIGHLRYLFEHLGEFFRQYFFAMDREELPFNRAMRSWVYRAAKGADNTVAFGSTRDLRPTGTAIFVNCPYPTLDRDASPIGPITIGPHAAQPYTTRALFHISAMSYGAISRPAVTALSHGAQMAGVWMNTGEGGLSPYHLEGGADIVFQIGTAKYGVRNDQGGLCDDKLREISAHPAVKMFELKLSQGAKPGKGGILPGAKVNAEIAAIRGIPEGHDSISPNRHPDIDSAEELLDAIEHIREVSGKPIGFKMVLGAYGWLDDLCAEIARRGERSAPDFITVDSADGGTGAAPMSLIDYMGLPLRESLPMVVDKLDEYGLRPRVRVVASGKLVTPAEVGLAICVGADFIASARGYMFALGCIQALQCNRNTCPTGITTHDKRLQAGLDVTDKAERVKRYADSIHKEIGIIAHSCGVSEPRRLRRYHCRVIGDDGRSRALHELYPPVSQKPQRVA
ncbi:MAG: FMN-binding glutamate synthase family protein [Pseudomonadota bacterium]